MSMTSREVEIVRSSFRSIEPMAATAAELFYNRLFELSPVSRAMFKGDIKQQGNKFMQVIAAAVAGFSNLPTLVPTIQLLGVRHASYGVRVEHYDSAQQALLWMLALVLQDAYTEEVRSAWVTAFTTLSGVMKEAAYGQPQLG